MSQADVARLTAELGKARQLVSSLRGKEDSLQQLLTQERQQRKKKEAGAGKQGTLSSMDKRPAALVRTLRDILHCDGASRSDDLCSQVRKYGELYAQTRLETLESLDKLADLDTHDDLKSKLLFSVIVVSVAKSSTTFA